MGASSDMRAWLEMLGLSKYGDAFAEAEIDFEVIRDLTEAEFEKIGIPLGSRKKLLRHRAAWRNASFEARCVAGPYA